MQSLTFNPWRFVTEQKADETRKEKPCDGCDISHDGYDFGQLLNNKAGFGDPQRLERPDAEQIKRRHERLRRRVVAQGPRLLA